MLVAVLAILPLAPPAGRSVSAWLALAFLALGLIVTVGRLVPAHPHGLLEDISQRLDIELLVLFPYLLYRFATAFVPPARACSGSSPR